MVEDSIQRLPVVAVYGSGSSGAGGPLAVCLGAEIARAGMHLLTGGGQGAMADAARGFVEVRPREGLSVGILPAGPDGTPPPGYPNRWIELAIRTHLTGAPGPASAQSRNRINVLTPASAFVLAGAEGTRAETRLALEAGLPIVGLRRPGRDGAAPFWDDLGASGLDIRTLSAEVDGDEVDADEIASIVRAHLAPLRSEGESPYAGSGSTGPGS